MGRGRGICDRFVRRGNCDRLCRSGGICDSLLSVSFLLVLGVIFGLFFVATDMPIIMSLAGAGIAGHLGTRSLMMLRSKYNLSE